MTNRDGVCGYSLTRRQALAVLAALGVAREVLAADAVRAADAVTADPRSYRVVLENDRVRVLEYTSRPGLGVCGQGMHYHPAHVTVSLTGAKLKETTSDGKVNFVDVPAGAVFFSEAVTHSTEIIGGQGTRSYIIELKGKDWKPSTG